MHIPLVNRKAMMVALFLLSVFAFWVNFERSTAVDRRCSPLTWCETAQHCGVSALCQSAARSRRPNDGSVKIEVYYETLCPDCRDFITNMLYPTFLLLGECMNLTVIPYGKAKESYNEQKKRYVFSCQHGEPECEGNMIQACLLNLTPIKALDIIFCMEAATDVLKATEYCVKLHAPEVSLKELMTCVKGDLGNQIMHQNALKTSALKPSLTSVPWITVNGVYTDDSQQKALSALLPLVCSLCSKEPKPVVCGSS